MNIFNSIVPKILLILTPNSDWYPRVTQILSGNWESKPWLVALELVPEKYFN